jgi:hypothetical protein
MSAPREPFDRSRAGFYVAHRIFEDAALADIAADDHQIAALAQMLHTSDRQAGAPVSIPRSVKQTWVDRWVEVALIELAPRDCYVVPGMAEAATKRIEKAKTAALARWGSDATGNAPGNATGNARTDAKPMPTVYGHGHVTKKRTKRSSPPLAEAREPRGNDAENDMEGEDEGSPTEDVSDVHATMDSDEALRRAFEDFPESRPKAWSA